MRAVTVPHYGPPDVVVLTRLPAPSPRADEVVLRVHAAAVTSGDARMRGGRFPRGFALPARLGIGFRGPRSPVLGVAVAGEVIQVGEGVTTVAVGDRVAGMTGARFGAHAEQARIRATALAHVPAGVTMADAAASLFGGTTARWYLIERARLRSGDRVLINGASGSVGSAAVQLAAHAGAEVTAVSSLRNHDLVRRLGAQHTIDYGQHPVSSLSETYDIVCDAVGNISRADGLRMLRPGGRLLLPVASLGDMLRARGSVIAGSASESAASASDILSRVATGTFDPLTRVTGGLESIVAAYRDIDSGRKVGNLVVEP